MSGDTSVKSDIVDKVSYSLVSSKPVIEVMRPLFGEPAFKNVSGDMGMVCVSVFDG